MIRLESSYACMTLGKRDRARKHPQIITIHNSTEIGGFNPRRRTKPTLAGLVESVRSYSPNKEVHLRFWWITVLEYWLGLVGFIRGGPVSFNKVRLSRFWMFLQP